MPEKTLWKIACQEDVYPGMWQQWFKHQCVAVGWAAMWGYCLGNDGKKERAWSVARKAINEMQIGDYIVVALKGNRVGRLGEITRKEIEDSQWNPLVPRGTGLKDGELGRRILVRWDLNIGPDNKDLVVQLPEKKRFSNGELRPTVSRIRSCTIEELKREMNDESNWVNLLGNFRYERALSDYIANYPNRLEDGLLPHPNSKIRERVFKDKKRIDVLLIDKESRPVIVECKQGSPTPSCIKQLRDYMCHFEKETELSARGILVHGGAAKLTSAAVSEARKSPPIEIVCYSLSLDFKSNTMHA